MAAVSALCSGTEFKLGRAGLPMRLTCCADAGWMNVDRRPAALTAGQALATGKGLGSAREPWLELRWRWRARSGELLEERLR